MRNHRRLAQMLVKLAGKPTVIRIRSEEAIRLEMNGLLVDLEAGTDRTMKRLEPLIEDLERQLA